MENDELLTEERILEQDGYRNVKSLTDPSEVVALYDQFEPDLVLLDLYMPKLDGFAVMKLLEDRISSDTFLPILILTAAGQRAGRQRQPRPVVPDRSAQRRLSPRPPRLGGSDRVGAAAAGCRRGTGR